MFNSNKNLEIEGLKAEMMYTKFWEALRSDIKVEVIKFGLMNFKDVVNNPIDVEKALDHQPFAVNVIISNTILNANLEIQTLLKQHLEQNKKIAELNQNCKIVK